MDSMFELATQTIQGSYAEGWQNLGSPLHDKLANVKWGIPWSGKNRIIAFAGMKNVYYEFGNNPMQISRMDIMGNNRKQAKEDDETLQMIRNAMRHSYTFYLMFGMCPVYLTRKKSKYSDDEFFWMTIPLPSDGKFVWRRMLDHTIEYGWRWNRSNRRNLPSMSKSPDKNVKVFVWPGKEPNVNSDFPFEAIFPRLYADWLRRNAAWYRHESGEFNAMNPRLIVQGKDSGSSLDRLAPGDIYNDIAGDGDPSKSVQHNIESRQDLSYTKRLEKSISSVYETTIAHRHRRTQDDGTYQYEEIPDSDNLRVIQLPNGTSTGTYPLPKTSSNIPGAMSQWWENRVAGMMGLPVELLLGRKSSAITTVGATNEMESVDETIEECRGVMINFVEWAWNELYRPAEDEMIKDRYTELDDMENVQRKSIVDYLRYLLANDPENDDIPEGTTAEKLESISPSDEQIKSPFGSVGMTVQTKAPNEYVSAMEKILYAQIERNQKISSITTMVSNHANNAGMPLDEMELRQQVIEIVNDIERGNEYRSENRQMLDTLKNTVNRIKIGFLTRFSTSDEKIDKMLETGNLDPKTAHEIKMIKNGMPLDTPMGEPLQIRLLKAKTDEDIRLLREKAKLEMNRMKQQEGMKLSAAKELNKQKQSMAPKLPIPEQQPLQANNPLPSGSQPAAPAKRAGKEKTGEGPKRKKRKEKRNGD